MTEGDSVSSETFPASIIVIGAGVFGLSTALAIAKRHPSTQINIIDRLVPPVLDGSSVDTTRCIRADYTDPIYARLARQAQTEIQNDPDLNRHMFQQGMTFVCDGQPGRFTNLWKVLVKNAKSAHPQGIVELLTRSDVFQSIHGEAAQPPQITDGKSSWNICYCNLEDAFIDAKECIQVYYDRCLKHQTINFMCGSAVNHIDIVNGVAKGVILENRSMIKADLTIVAAGAWSNKSVFLKNRLLSIGHEVAWIKVTPEEESNWKNMPITTNLSTGLNMFPPYQGGIKILRRSPGYINTQNVPHPEDPSKIIEISYPRTIVDNPKDVIPADAEAEMRKNLEEIMPSLASRPFDRTKICWISTTPTSDFLIAPHPRVKNIHLATGGSAHAWKFLPTIGGFVVDSIEGVLPPDLVAKWAYERSLKGDEDQNAPRMDGKPQELRDVVRSRM